MWLRVKYIMHRFINRRYIGPSWTYAELARRVPSLVEHLSPTEMLGSAILIREQLHKKESNQCIVFLFSTERQK